MVTYKTGGILITAIQRPLEVSTQVCATLLKYNRTNQTDENLNHTPDVYHCCLRLSSFHVLPKACPFS